MAGKMDEVGIYVRRRIQRWQSNAAESYVRAELAELRKGIGKKPGEIPNLWGVIFEDLPERLMSTTGRPSWAEWSIYITLTLFALHQQGSEQGSAEVYQDGNSLGRAVGQLASRNDNLERVRKRFTILATSADIQECAHYLRGMIQLLRSEKIPLDYPALAKDLYEYQISGGREKVRLRWGQDFYQTYHKIGEVDENEE